MNRRRRLSPLDGLILLLCLAVLVSGGLLGRDLYRAGRERAANAALVRRAEQAASALRAAGADKAPAAGTEDVPDGEPERDYRPLVLENSDLAAWLTIGGTAVDYPVLYTPEDPEHYLHRAFDGSRALSGSLFIGAGCRPDGANVIIYGHNMRDGSMFGSLTRYASRDYAEAHPEILYDRLLPEGGHERLTFQVMAAFYSRVYRVDERDVFRYYRGTDLSEPEAFAAYVEEVMAASLYDLGVTASCGDRLLTLSTCSYHTEDGRFVVVARAEGADSTPEVGDRAS